jgi:hypothetical protein
MSVIKLVLVQFIFDVNLMVKYCDVFKAPYIKLVPRKIHVIAKCVTALTAFVS